MKHTIFVILSIAMLSIFSCKNQNSDKNQERMDDLLTLIKTPQDPKAAAIADDVMKAMGGTEQWSDLKYISWTFFGSRHLVWDKLNNRVRIESQKDTSIYLVDLNTGRGKIKKAGKVILSSEDPEAVARGKSIWINDMYWLFMPFKLTDPGVNLKYVRQDTTATGVMADILELTFNKVGDTPENKYEVFVDQNDNLIKQWSFFPKAEQTEPARVWPWDNYKDYNGLKLSAERSDDGGPSNVRVYDVLGDEVFTEFGAFEFY